MRATTHVQPRYTVLRGRVENLEGSTKSALASWARFDLGFTKVLIHSFYVLPPNLAEGDEVAVVGSPRRGLLDAGACVKLAETREEWDSRQRRQRWRRAFWISLKAVFVLGGLIALGLKHIEGVFPEFSWIALASVCFCLIEYGFISGHRMLELEVALALEQGSEKAAETFFEEGVEVS